MVPDSQTEASSRAGRGVDWRDWHASYERPSSPMAERLALVVRHVAAAIKERPPGPITVISICAGQGHDLLGALRDHPRRADVRARLVELDMENVAAARAAVRREHLAGIDVVQGDASLLDAYTDVTPADVILLCGVLGNISAEDVQRTVSLLPSLCSMGAHVVWTRNRNPPDLVPALLEMFAEAGFTTPHVDDGPNLAVATSLLTVPPPAAAPAGTRLFEFVGQGALWPHLPEHTREAMLGLFETSGTLGELVEAVHAIPLGGPAEQSIERMLREGRGTPVSKHLLLADMLGRRFPHTAPRALFRLCDLDERRARHIYGPTAAAAVAAHGGRVADVHCYLTLVVESRRIRLDVSVPGSAWDGHSDLSPACGPGDDRIVGETPWAQLEDLLATVREGPGRAALESAVGGLGLIHPHGEPPPQA